MVRSSDYRKSIEQRDNRLRLLVRTASLVASATLAALALWGAGADPSKWYAAVRPSTHPAPRAAAPSVGPVAPKVVLPEPAASRATALPGTNSSVAKVAQHLILAGTVLGKNYREGTAILGVSRENLQTYAAGAILANGVRITEIHSKYVLLERDGRSERLYLDGTDSAANGSKSDGALTSVGGAEPGKRTVVADSIEPITDYFRPTPVYDGSVLTGYQVYPGTSSGVFAQLGLQAGDVLTSVNGAPFTDPDQAIAAFRELLQGASLMVTILRKGVVEKLSLDGTRIPNAVPRMSAADESR